MTTASYGPSLARLKVHEGGYTNDPKDPGGPTNWGVTIYDVRKFVKPGATAADVKALAWDPQAMTVYRREYWIANHLSCDDLAAGVDDSIFDYRVNSGVGRADKVLRRVCGLPDNASNADLLVALAKRDPKAIIIAINDERLRFLKSLKTWDHFGKGWGARVAEVKTFSLQLADRAAAPAPSAAIIALPTPNPEVQAAGKGKVPLPAPVANAGKIIATGTVGSGVGAWHWIAAHPSIAFVGATAGLMAAGAVVLAFERHHQAKQDAATPGLVPVPATA